MAYFGGAGGNNPWALSEGSADWLGRTQDYIGRTTPGMETNPYASGAEGFSNPMLSGLFDTYDTRLDQFSNVDMGDFDAARDRFSQAPEVSFEPDRFSYGNAVTGEGIKMDLSLLGGGASGGTAYGSEVDDIDEAATVRRAQTLFQDVTGPGVTAAASSAGMGRGGAEIEALAAEGKRLALPISQQVLKHASDAALMEADLATKASIATAGYATQASVANAQVRGRLAEMDYLKRAEGALQAQALTAKSDAQWNQIMGDIAVINEQLQMKANELGADMSKYRLGAQVRGQEIGADLSKFGLQQGLGAYGAGVDYSLKAPGAITGLMGMGLAASEYGPNLARTDQMRQQNFLGQLMGSVPAPGGGSTTSTQYDTGNFWDKWNQLHSDYAKLAMSASGAAGWGRRRRDGRRRVDVRVGGGEHADGNSVPAHALERV